MNKVKDAKSTAVILIVVGLAGLVALVLFLCGVLPFNVGLAQKIMYTIVIGLVFGMFLIVGIIYAFSINKIKAKEDQRITTENEIIESFINDHKNDNFDNGSEEIEEELFFIRSSKIIKILEQEHPELEASQIEQYAEIIYDKIF